MLNGPIAGILCTAFTAIALLVVGQAGVSGLSPLVRLPWVCGKSSKELRKTFNGLVFEGKIHGQSLLGRCKSCGLGFCASHGPERVSHEGPVSRWPLVKKTASRR